jgi:hypothetical protein
MIREKGNHKMPSVTPIVVLAAELDETIDSLLMQIGDDAIVIDEGGVRSVTSSLARRLTDARRASEQARRDQDRAERAAAAAEPNAAQERVKRLQRQQAAWNNAADPRASAIERAFAADPQSKFNRNDRDLAEQLSGEIVLHRLTPNHQEQ